MAISYPVSTPTSIGIANIELSASNAVAVSRSPFTFSQQVHTYPGQMWSATVSIPPVRKDLAEPWVAFLLSLRGQTGTFLLGDPNNTSPRGTATAATITGTSGSSSLTVTMTGTLLAGDYIQLGSGSDATLHKVLVDRSGSGTLEVWPALRKDRTAVSAVLTDCKGVFRLSSNNQSWSINDNSAYGIQFECMEVV
jgi:hypothetical protein